MEDVKKTFSTEEKQEIETLVRKVKDLSAPQRIRLFGVIEGISLAGEIEKAGTSASA